MKMAMMKIDQYISYMYSVIKYRCKKKWNTVPDFTKEDLAKWLYENDLANMWIRYIESGLDKKIKPSIDRIDDYKSYTLSNMQLITWRENQLKGVNGKKHHESYKNENLKKKVFIWDKLGNLKAVCNGGREASEYLGCFIFSVSRAATGKRKTVKKHILTYTDEFPTKTKC